MPNQTFQDVFGTLTHPWVFMFLSLRHAPQTVAELVSESRWRDLFSVSGFCDALFGNFWATAGPMVKMNASARVVPLLEGRISNGKIHEDVVSTPVSGVVLEIGAGTGMWADVFARLVAGKATPKEGEDQVGVRKRSSPGAGITKIYGVEPHPKSASTLKKRVKELGMDDVYEVIPVGIESLDDPNAWTGTTIEPGSVDCIVSVLCLCSIPEPAENVRHLHKLLKPGGRWYAYEHVRVPSKYPVLRMYQWFVNIFWSFFIGSCRLCRDTGVSLRQAGPWTSIDLEKPSQEIPYALLPHVIGTLTK